MRLIDALGYAAAALTTAAFVPQAWLTFRSRDVSGISLAMYSVFTAGIALWLAYGVLLRAWPIVVANAVTLALAAAILAMKLLLTDRSGQKRGPTASEAVDQKV
jgi:MtN3 and saliva related transmembrane protein